MRLGLLGGTFDPIHLGHLILAGCAAEQLKLDRVRFIPAGDPWRKAARTVTSAEMRLAMVRLATSTDARFEVDDRELRREGPTYTSDTLVEIRAEMGPDSRLYFLVGEDALEDMRYWHEPEAIFESARLGVAPRMETAVPAAPPLHEGVALSLPEYDRIDMPSIGISSSDLRARVARGESIRYLVPDAVERYIREQRLYRR